MKKLIIGALVGSLILFIWQFLSWAALNLHGSTMDYTPKQEIILDALAKSNLEEGEYFLPRLPQGASGEEQEAFTQKVLGKPWAKISYHNNFENTMGMNLFRGFVIDFLVAFLICWILLKMRDLDFMTSLTTCLAIGLVGYLMISYLDSIWFKNNSIPYLIDSIVQFGILGAWLGFWLPRGELKSARD